MLGIEFMRAPTQLGLNAVDGFEFMDFQKPTVYKGLVEILNRVCKREADGDVVLKWNDNAIATFEDFILDSTGILVKVNDDNSVGNAAIEAGYFSPNNLLNIEGLDAWYDAKHTNVAQAMKTLRVDILKGWVDTSTGKVGGDFSKIQFNLWVQGYIDSFMKTKKLEKFNVTPAEAIAGIVLHELGHAFTAFVFAFQSALDAIFPLAAVRMAVNAQGENQRAQIIKDSLKAMECSEKIKDSDLHLLETSEGISLFFDKALENRNLRRTLSLGVTSRSSESFADIFAVRMGAGRPLIAAIASMQREMPTFIRVFMSAYLFVIYAAWFNTGVGAAAVITYNTIISLLELTDRLVPDSSYDSPYRRLRAMLREMISEIQSTDYLTPIDKKRTINNCKELAKKIEDEKSLLESTAVQRTLGWLCSGSDFRAQDFEHHTQDLMAHEISLYKDYFKD